MLRPTSKISGTLLQVSFVLGSVLPFIRVSEAQLLRSLPGDRVGGGVSRGPREPWRPFHACVRPLLTQGGITRRRRFPGSYLGPECMKSDEQRDLSSPGKRFTPSTATKATGPVREPWTVGSAAELCQQSSRPGGHTRQVAPQAEGGPARPPGT